MNLEKLEVSNQLLLLNSYQSMDVHTGCMWTVLELIYFVSPSETNNEKNINVVM